MIDFHNLFTHGSLFYLNHIFCHSVCVKWHMWTNMHYTESIEEIFKYIREWEVVLIKSYRTCLTNVFGTHIFLFVGLSIIP